MEFESMTFRIRKLCFPIPRYQSVIAKRLVIPSSAVCSFLKSKASLLIPRLSYRPFKAKYLNPI